MEIYFDNAATTKPSEEVLNAMLEAYTKDYGNAAALHLMGVAAENCIKQSIATIAGILKVEPKEIFFTSGGTESNNMALSGAAKANERTGKHIITTKTEHASVTNTLLALEEEGFEITFLDVDSNGRIRLEELEQAIRQDTILVSTIFVNNEIGTIQQVEEIGTLIKKKNKNTLYHVDAVQAFGKLPIFPKKMNIDLLSTSSHKLHGPKGIGICYIKEGTKVKPLIYGGGHQRGMRSGTENTPSVVGTALAAKLAYDTLSATTKYIAGLKQHFIERIAEIDEIQINAEQQYTVPNIINVSFKKIRSEVLLHTLEAKGIFISTGSACSSNKKGLSTVIAAIGVSKDYKDGAIRFSFSKYNTVEEIDYCIDTLKKEIPILRKYTRG